MSYSRIDLKNNESIFSVQFQKVISEKCDLRHETRNPPHRWDLETKTWGPKVGTETLIICDTQDAESGYSDGFLSFLRVWLERINSRASCV